MMGERIKVLIDADTGVDDSIALLYALQKPEIEILGITTVCGNVSASQAAENTLKILDLVDAPDIPVVAGYERPMKKEWGGCVSFIHGTNGLGDVALPESSRTVTERDVCQFQMELARKHQGELVLVTLGPLTNIAHTLERYPEFAGCISRMVMMGGTVSMRGNVSPVCEANVACDPEACDQVFLSGMDITAVGLDVTLKTRLKKEHIEFLERNSMPSLKKAVSYMKEALEYYRKGNQMQNYCIDDSPLHDPLAMMTVVEPSLVRTESRRARVECQGTYCQGMVVTDLREKPIQANHIRFAMEVDGDRAIRELLSAFNERG